MAVLVVGMGSMGRGIATVLATKAKVPVIIVDTSKDAIESADKYILKQVQKTDPRVKDTKQFISKFNSLEEAVKNSNGSVEFIIEAVSENFELKKIIFKELERSVGPNVILASNTSSLPISQLAESVKHPERVIGMHFFNPVPKMAGLEVIPTKYTAREVLTKTVEWGKRMGKTVGVCKSDIAGFVVNRILNANFLEVMSLLEIGAATPEDIDNLMVKCTNAPMGPFKLTDLVGLDTTAAIAHIIYEQSGKNPKYKPSKLLDEMVKDGKLGMKSGEGFYKYPKSKS